MNRSYQEQTGRLLAWLLTWRTSCHAYQGYVVHRGNLKRMKEIHDTPWAQAPIIEGLLNQFQKSGDQRWLEAAHGAALLQASRFDGETARFRYAGFEDDRFSSLVHNALAGCALLRAASLLDPFPQYRESAAAFRRIVRELADRYFIAVLYNPAIPAFRFNEVDYYSSSDRYTLNMNSVALQMLVELCRCSGDKKYLEIAGGVGEWMLTQGYRSDDPRLDGGLFYQEVPGEPSAETTMVSIYTALALRGFIALYRETGDLRYREMVERACRHLVRFVTPEGFFAHQYQVEKKLLREYPCWIAGAGIIFNGLDDARELGIEAEYREQLERVLERQLPNGAFENFHRYREGVGEVWEDVVPIVGWNAHLFEYLSRKVTLDFASVLKARLPAVWRRSQNYLYWESSRLALVLGKAPHSSRGLYLVWKKFPRSLVAFP